MDANRGIQKVRVEPATRSAVATRTNTNIISGEMSVWLASLGAAIWNGRAVQLVEIHSVELYPLDLQDIVTAWLW